VHRKHAVCSEFWVLSLNIDLIGETISAVVADIVFNNPVARIANEPFTEKHRVSFFNIQFFGKFCVGGDRAYLFF
jgi:hypothetical protein